MGNPQDGKWLVIRQDSNGNRFIEAKDLTDIAAEKFVDIREKQIGAHHQSVWKQDQATPAPYPELLVILAL